MAAASSLERQIAEELSSADVFARKFSHGRLLSEGQVAALSLAGAMAAKRSPFRKAQQVKGLKDMLFVAGDANLATPPPIPKGNAAATAAAATAAAAASSSSSSSSSSSLAASAASSSSPQPLELPASTYTPPSSISERSLHVREKFVDAWRRAFVAPERRKIAKQRMKHGVEEKKNTKKTTDDDDEEEEQEEQEPEEGEQEEEDDEEEEDEEASKKKSGKKNKDEIPASNSSCSAGADCICFRCSDFYSPLQASIFSSLASYRDLIYTNSNAHVTRTLHQVLALHAVNHLSKANHAVAKHTKRIKAWEDAERKRREDEINQKRKWRDDLKAGGERAAKAKAEQAAKVAAAATSGLAAAAASAALDPEPEHRDQGFTKPRVLALFPTAAVAHEFILKVVTLYSDKADSKQSGQGRKRFEQEFAPTVDDRCHPRKPFDYKLLFDGKDNDAFRIGLSFRGANVKFFTSFDASDLIVASPLGLRMITGSAGDSVKAREYDFLSSIELLIIDQFDVCAGMQNLAHLQAVMDVMNALPYKLGSMDISRIRGWSAAQQAKYFRQTVILANHPSMELQAFQANYCRNADGKLQMRTAYKGILSKVIPQVKQIFQRIHCDNIKVSSTGSETMHNSRSAAEPTADEW